LASTAPLAATETGCWTRFGIRTRTGTTWSAATLVFGPHPAKATTASRQTISSFPELALSKIE
jgi:hypothetical protein